MASVPPTDPSPPLAELADSPVEDSPLEEVPAVDDPVSYVASEAVSEEGSSDDRPLRYNVRLPLILLLLSCVSIFIAGCCRWVPFQVFGECLQSGALDFTPLRRAILTEWKTGLVFAASLLGILIAHELGHFFMTVVYRVRATLPMVFPFPISPIGTLGAVIAMEPGKADRKQIFDIGIAGPLAGLVIAIPVLWAGLNQVHWQEQPAGLMAVKPPLLMEWWLRYLHPAEWRAAGGEIWMSQANPLLIAGCFGLFFTGLNMFPVGQLDGGHITYTLLGKKAHWLARGLMVLSFAYMAYTGNTMLLLMALLVMLMGTDHPPTSDDSVELGWPRVLLGWVSLIIPIVCLTPDFIVLP
jgi:membrane-associated protease RseP (regulator of RpoE activity)